MARSYEETLRAKREGMARLRARDPEAARLKRNAFHAKNRERQTAWMREYAKRRFFWNREMHLRGADRATAAQLASLWRRQRGHCALTGRRLGRDAHLDHIVPIARGGSHDIGNLRWLCHEANLAKRALSDEQFFALCVDVAQGLPCMAWIGRRIQQVSEIEQVEAIA